MFYKAMAVCCTAGMLAWATDAMAQSSDCSHSILLQVREAKTGIALPGVAIHSSQQQVMTDMEGFAPLDKLCPGTLHLHLQALGYEPVDADFSFSPGDTLLIQLNTTARSLDEIEVRGHRLALNTTTLVHSLHQTDLDKLKGKGLAAMLQGIPGVNVLQTGATIGKPVIDGMHSNRILILNNGIRQEGQQWGSEHAPEIDPFVAQTLSVVKGAEAIRFGAEAIGGVIIVEPAALPQDSTLHAELNLAGSSNGRSGIASAMLSGNPKQVPFLSWRLQGTGKRTGNVHNRQYYLENTGSSELNYSATLGLKAAHMDLELFYSRFHTALGILSQAHIGNESDRQALMHLGRPFEDGKFSYEFAAPKQHIQHDLFRAKGHAHLSDHLHINLQYGLQHNSRKEFDRRRAGRTDIPSLSLALQTHTLDAFLEFFDGTHWKATLGINGLLQKNKTDVQTFARPIIPDYNSEGAGAYAIVKRSGRILDLEGGLRYDYKYLTARGYNDQGSLYGGRHHFNNLNASMGAVWHSSSLWSLRSNIGTAWRPPAINELYSNGLHHGTATVELGDSTLLSEKSIKWITAFEYHNLAGWLRLDVDVYAQVFDNYLYLRANGNSVQTVAGSFPEMEYVQDAAGVMGADFNASLKIAGPLSYNLKGSYLYARNTSRHNYLPLIPANRVEQSLKLDLKRLRFLRNSYIALSHSYVARQYNYTSGTDFLPPPPAYNLVHFQCGTELAGTKHPLAVHFSVENITNNLYRDYMNRFRFYTQEMGRNITLRLSYRI
jgi:iron complex outermembrane receptor protein